MHSVEISHVFHGQKCSLINFKKLDSKETFYNVALAFPYRWRDKVREDIPADQFRSALSVGKEVSIHWSKKLSAYVVSF